MTALLIREAIADDAPALVDLLVELGHPATAEAILSRLERMQASGFDRAYVAVEDDTPVGLVTVHWAQQIHREQPRGRIMVLIVKAAKRGQGIGQRLVEKAKAVLRQQGCGTVEVTSNQTRIEAHAFYRNLGFQQTSEHFWQSLD